MGGASDTDCGDALSGRGGMSMITLGTLALDRRWNPVSIQPFNDRASSSIRRMAEPRGSLATFSGSGSAANVAGPERTAEKRPIRSVRLTRYDPAL